MINKSIFYTVRKALDYINIDRKHDSSVKCRLILQTMNSCVSNSLSYTLTSYGNWQSLHSVSWFSWISWHHSFSSPSFYIQQISYLTMIIISGAIKWRIPYKRQLFYYLEQLKYVFKEYYPYVSIPLFLLLII